MRDHVRASRIATFGETHPIAYGRHLVAHDRHESASGDRCRPVAFDIHDAGDLKLRVLVGEVSFTTVIPTVQCE